MADQTHSILTRLHNLLGGILGMAQGMSSNIPAMAGSIPQIRQMQSEHASIGELIAAAAPEIEKVVAEVEADTSAGSLNAAEAAANPTGETPPAA